MATKETEAGGPSRLRRRGGNGEGPRSQTHALDFCAPSRKLLGERKRRKSAFLRPASRFPTTPPLLPPSESPTRL